MVQVFDLSPTESSASIIGKALGTGISKQLGISEAENAFKTARGDPLKLATAMGRLLAASPDLGRAAGPMYQAILAQMRGQEMAGAAGAGGPQQSPYMPQGQPEPQPGQAGNAPTVNEFEPQEATRKPYIPRQHGEIVKASAAKYPQLFAQDPNAAIEQEYRNEQQEIARSQAFQDQRLKQADIENTLKQKLRDEMQTLGIQPGEGIAGNLFSNIENKAIQSLKPVSEGGEGLTEQQAAKKYGKEIDSAARDYNVIKSWGGTYTMNPLGAKNVRRQIEAVKQKFKERNDLENFADLLVAENGVSPMVSRYLAYDLKDNKDLSKDLKSVPFVPPESSDEFKAKKTLEIAPKLAEELGKDSSPLAVAQFLKSKGYDAGAWLDYLNQNRKRLDLTERQGRELGMSVSPIPNLTDIWMLIVDDKEKVLGY